MRKVSLLVLLYLILSHYSFSQVATYKGQALFIYNFIKHIKWESSPEIFTIGVYDNADLLNELNNTLKNKQVDGKGFLVKPITSAQEAVKCQMVYVSAAKEAEITQIITAVNNKDVLVVSETDLSDKGAGISFLMIEDKLKFKINQSALAKQGLMVSAGLLSLAMK